MGGFRVVASIHGGKGSQGSVVKAVCERETIPGVAVGEVVALKTMSVRDDDGSVYAAFANRTEMLMGIVHPNIVRYRGCFSVSGPFSAIHVLVMEFLEGETLKERLAANPGGVDADEAVRVIGGVLSGLDAASRAGIVHRDIKPGNIFICRDGSVKLIDFEIARKEGGSVSTASGRFAGTFDYMAPEFADPAFRGDARSDVFSAGVVFHEMLTGTVPYAREKEKGEQADFAFLSRWSQRQEGLCAIRIRSTVKRLLAHADEVIKRSLEEDPDKRYQSAAEFAEGLKSIRFRELRSPTRSYRLLQVIGRGGFGEVFKARIRGTRDFVAVKHLLKSTYGDRFRREARVMRQLDDPAFVRFVDYFEAQHAGGEEAFLVMAYLPGMPGMSLRDAIRARDRVPMPKGDVLKAFARYAHALATMHRQGIYHRDIKPANLYYPTGHPEAAAIMDLGIARDVNGTATSGQVPGTLDYMPPEIVLGSSRGDAGMDIYALGLCLYEAIAGKTAYPRLPTGPTAFAAFYERARSKAPPIFEHQELDSSPKLRALLEDMTALDSFSRLQSAESVFLRIKEICGESCARPEPRPVTAPRPEPRRKSIPRPAPVVVKDDPDTVQTSPAGGGAARNAHASGRDSGFLGGWALKIAVAAAVVTALAIAAGMAWEPAARWLDDYKKASAKRRQHEIEESVRLRKQAEEEAERRRAESVRQNAVAEAVEVVKKFEGFADSALAAGNSAGEWALKWRSNDDVRPVFAAQTNRFAAAAKARAARDRRDADKANMVKAEREASEIVAAYDGRDVSSADCNDRAAEWNKAWKPLLDKTTYDRLSAMVAEALVRRRNRDADDKARVDDAARRREVVEAAETSATAQAKELVRRFADETVSVAAARAEYAVWQNEWGKYSSEAFFQRCRASIEKAECERNLAESGRSVKAECERWLANIRSSTSVDVRNWRVNLDRAELELKKAIGERRISAKDAAEVRSRIEACRRWSVGVVDNKTYRTVEFAGKTIAPVSSATIVFTNGIPAGLAVTSAGCEPFRVRETDFDANVTIVMPKNLVESVGGAKARVPSFGEGVVCLVDGVERTPGVVDVRPGRHHVLWRLVRETYPGIRDFRDQDIPFEVERSGMVDVPSPSTTWTYSQEFEAMRQNAGQVEKGRQVLARIEECLVPEPLETRRRRLEKAYGILSDWQTSSALAVLGEGVELDIRGKYEAERRRVRGYVKNDADIPATVKTDIGETAIAPGERKVVTFEKSWSSQAYATLPNYEFVFLPRVRDDFDGKEFVIEQSKLVPLPVKVKVPSLGEGVACEIEGNAVSGEAKIRPGTYGCVYRKPDCKPQKFDLTIRIGEDVTLPPPRAWEPSGALSVFADALSSFASGAVDHAKDLTSKIGTIEDPQKRRELEELKRAIELREKLEGK